MVRSSAANTFMICSDSAPRWPASIRASQDREVPAQRARLCWLSWARVRSARVVAPSGPVVDGDVAHSRPLVLKPARCVLARRQCSISTIEDRPLDGNRPSGSMVRRSGGPVGIETTNRGMAASYRRSSCLAAFKPPDRWRVLVARGRLATSRDSRVTAPDGSVRIRRPRSSDPRRILPTMGSTKPSLS